MLLRKALAFKKMSCLREADKLFRTLHPHSYGRAKTTADDVCRRLEAAGRGGWKREEQDEVARIAGFWKERATEQRAHARNAQAAAFAEEKQSNDEGNEVEEDELHINFIRLPVDENADWQYQTEWDAFVSW